MVELVLACFSAGAIAWPLNDRYTPAEVLRLIDDAEPRIAVVPDALAAAVDGAVAVASSGSRRRWRPSIRPPGPIPPRRTPRRC